jgi:hypothetical protein
MPKLIAARQRYEAAQQQASHANEKAYAVTRQIEVLEARRRSLQAARARVRRVEELGRLKAELLALEEQVEVLHIQREPLESVARARSDALRGEHASYSVMCEAATLALGRAREQHFWGQDARHKARRLAELTDLIGAEEVVTYVTSLSSPTEIRAPGQTPPWAQGPLY